ncbi:DUF6058 family natural product biosynthesis protein [Undibacterium sp. Di27W]|uniref:DUF6058 family natural product biosynthesis protein n=1 Tax=Undibacterium sp. Di27W TaxID=3413036 RepID=UPI003BF114C1
MSELQLYLNKYFLTKAQFAAACGIPEAELNDLLAAQILPGPSYVISEKATINSAVFGESDAADTIASDYFRASHTVWCDRAKQLVAEHGLAAASETMKQEFMRDYIAALTELNASVWHMQDCFEQDGTANAAGLTENAEFHWKHFLLGTFGICTANPVSAAEIARKGVLQLKLSSLTGNGSKNEFSHAEANDILPVVDAFADAVMCFSPAEFARSSRKRLVDDIRPKLQAVLSR